jgi:enoyl-[acyl-carrier protein] reductase II
MKAHGMKIVVMTGKVKHAVRAEQAGADVVAAQGTEAGGHTARSARSRSCRRSSTR